MQDLPVDVLSKSVSYKIGEPEYVKIKHRKALKRILYKYNFQDLVRK